MESSVMSAWCCLSLLFINLLIYLFISYLLICYCLLLLDPVAERHLALPRNPHPPQHRACSDHGRVLVWRQCFIWRRRHFHRISRPGACTYHACAEIFPNLMPALMPALMLAGAGIPDIPVHDGPLRQCQCHRRRCGVVMLCAGRHKLPLQASGAARPARRASLWALDWRSFSSLSSSSPSAPSSSMHCTDYRMIHVWRGNFRKNERCAGKHWELWRDCGWNRLASNAQHHNHR